MGNYLAFITLSIQAFGNIQNICVVWRMLLKTSIETSY